MNSPAPGKNISNVEVTNISVHGIWLWARGRELFMPYEHFPWFREQKIKAIFNVEEPVPGHFHWPELDIDLSEEIIDHPERFPLTPKQNLITKRFD